VRDILGQVDVVCRDEDRAVLAEGEGREHEAEGDEDATGGDERDHVGDTGHQPLTDRVPSGDESTLVARPPVRPRLPRQRPWRVGSEVRCGSSGLGDEPGPSLIARLTPTSMVGLPAEAGSVLDREVVGGPRRQRRR
jgi:hypothetical protein